MQLWRKYRPLPPWWLPVLLLLNACGGEETGCDSLGARTSVVKIISDDGNNALLNYAVKNSSSVGAMVTGSNTEAEKSAVWERARQGAEYELDDTIRTNRGQMERCPLQSTRFCFEAQKGAFTDLVQTIPLRAVPNAISSRWAAG